MQFVCIHSLQMQWSHLLVVTLTFLINRFLSGHCLTIMLNIKMGNRLKLKLDKL